MSNLFMVLWLISGCVFFVFAILWIVAKARKENTRTRKIITLSSLAASIIFLIAGTISISNEVDKDRVVNSQKGVGNEKPQTVDESSYKQTGIAENESEGVVHRVVVFETNVDDKKILSEHAAKTIYELTKESGKLTGFGYVHYFKEGQSNLPNDFNFDSELGQEGKILHYWKAPNGREFIMLSGQKEEIETPFQKSFAVLKRELEKQIPDFEVLEHSVENDGTFQYVTGKIKNNKSKNYSYVQVEISLYDSDGNQVGSTLDNMNNLEAGATWKFKALVTENNASQYKIVNVTGF